MHRGTTPTLTVAPDEPITMLRTAELSLAQPEHDVLIVRRDLARDETANTFAVTLTQEETLRLRPGKVLVQLRALTTDGKALAIIISSCLLTTPVWLLLGDFPFTTEQDFEAASHWVQCAVFSGGCPIKEDVIMSRLKNGDVLLGWPLSVHCITAGWTYNSGAAHNALDFRAAVGTPVFAAEGGTVETAYPWNGRVTKGDTNSYGNMVKIKHHNYCGLLLETLYAHLKTICVKVGQTVKQGQLIGYSGCTGNCQGAHLHFEVRYAGLRVNPLYWLDEDFACANSSVKAHLGTYKSVVPDSAETGAHKEPVPEEVKLQTVAIGPVSAGDAMRFWDLAKELDVPYASVEV